MELDEKYFKLLNLIIHDKRNKTNGMITDIMISCYFNTTLISYQAFMNSGYSKVSIFLDDIEKGNIVFLLPYGLNYKAKEMEELSKKYEIRIKEFFGDKFREDMIMRISEDERQDEIRKWRELTLGLKNWDMKFRK